MMKAQRKQINRRNEQRDTQKHRQGTGTRKEKCKEDSHINKTTNYLIFKKIISWYLCNVVDIFIMYIIVFGTVN